MKIIKLLVLVWVMKSFETFDGVLKFLNTLPDQTALKAKVVCTDWNMPCVVIYPVAKQALAEGDDSLAEQEGK